MMRPHAAGFLLLLLFLAPGQVQAACDPDDFQDSGAIYRICMPPASAYNGSLVIWAHGYQDAGTPVSMPEDQLCIGNTCLSDLVNQLGFAFATTSYHKTGLAVRQGKADILDLVDIFTKQKGKPVKVYLIGASEGGLITALALEQRPDVFSAGVAACGPIGDFPLQINYLADARVTFEYFFPGLIPGDILSPDPGVVADWEAYYEAFVEPVVFDPANRHQLDQWVRAGNLPFEASDYLSTVAISVEDVLRYSVVNITDAVLTLRGIPFENRFRWYTGSDNDFLLNLLVRRVTADPAAVAEMNSFYSTTGVLVRPLITLHTLRDQQVPYVHEIIYDLKTLFSGSFLTRHLNLPIDRFEHCNFTIEEALFSFAVMLFYDGVLQGISGSHPLLTPSQQVVFESRLKTAKIPYQRTKGALSFVLK
jgi:pimeloyl-ACP methyl ester carboxylesterase